MFRRRKLTPAAELRPGDELVRSMQRFLYAQAFVTMPTGRGLRPDCRWVMSPAWLEVVADLSGARQQIAGQRLSEDPHILGMPVETREDGGRPHVVAG